MAELKQNLAELRQNSHKYILPNSAFFLAYIHFIFLNSAFLLYCITLYIFSKNLRESWRR